MENVRPYDKEYNLPDGSKRPVIIGGVTVSYNPLSGIAFAIDNTERKKSERELQKSEERLKLVIEASNDGIWEWDIISNQIVWSDKIYQMFQLSKQDFDGTFESIQNLVHPDDRQKFLDAINDHLSTNYPSKIEIRYLRGDGRYGFFLCKGQAERTKAGDANKMIGSISDISERKFAEMKVLESLKFVNTIIDLSPIGIIT